MKRYLKPIWPGISWAPFHWCFKRGQPMKDFGWSQDKKGKSTAKAGCGGSCGGTGLWNTQGVTSLSWWTLTTFSSRMSPSSTHPFGLSILFIAGIILAFQQISYFLPILLYYYYRLRFCCIFPFSNVVIKRVTILAPLNAPNTDGIDPGVWAFDALM